MADGYGFGAEGDWKTAMLVRIAAVMGAGLPGGASLMEDYTYHMVPGEELSLGAHMLEVSPSLSSQRARLDIAPLSIGGKEDPVRLVFTADPGPAVVLALSDMRDRFRLVAAEVECVPLPAAMPNLPVGHAVWRSKPDFRTAATAWLAAGASHHTAMSNQITTRVVQDFAVDDRRRTARDRRHRRPSNRPSANSGSTAPRSADAGGPSVASSPGRGYSGQRLLCRWHEFAVCVEPRCGAAGTSTRDVRAAAARRGIRQRGVGCERTDAFQSDALTDQRRVLEGPRLVLSRVQPRVLVLRRIRLVDPARQVRSRHAVGR